MKFIEDKVIVSDTFVDGVHDRMYDADCISHAYCYRCPASSHHYTSGCPICGEPIADPCRYLRCGGCGSTIHMCVGMFIYKIFVQPPIIGRLTMRYSHFVMEGTEKL